MPFCLLISIMRIIACRSRSKAVMANKIKVKHIRELHVAGVSRNTRADTQNIGRNSLSDVIRTAQRRCNSADDIRAISKEEAYPLFNPNKSQEESIYPVPGYDHVHEELTKTRVTLKLFWKEYSSYMINDRLATGYTRLYEG